MAKRKKKHANPAELKWMMQEQQKDHDARAIQKQYTPGSLSQEDINKLLLLREQL